jgi:hypothetical protein
LNVEVTDALSIAVFVGARENLQGSIVAEGRTELIVAVGKNEDLSGIALVVNEVASDAFLGHDAKREREIRFSVLHAVLSGGVVRRFRGDAELAAVRLESLPEHLLEDVERVHLLEDPRVPVLSERIESGNHPHADGARASTAGALLDPRDDAANVPHLRPPLDPK